MLHLGTRDEVCQQGEFRENGVMCLQWRGGGALAAWKPREAAEEKKEVPRRISSGRLVVGAWVVCRRRGWKGEGGGQKQKI